MTPFFKKLLRSPWFIFVAVLLVIGMTYVLGDVYDVEREEWPGWLQTIGSVGAILVAIWVPWQQSEAQRHRDHMREQADLNGMLQTICAEIETSLDFTSHEIGPAITHGARSTPIRFVFPLAENSFPIFNAFIPRLGSIPDHALRKRILVAFGLAKGFVLTTNHHNQLVEAFELAVARHRFSPTAEHGQEAERQLEVLTRYSDSLRDSYRTATTAARNLVTELKARE